MKTVLKSNDGWYTIAMKGSQFYLCAFNEETGKYRKLHVHGTYYHVALNLDRSIVWNVIDDSPKQYDLFSYMDSLPESTPAIVAQSSIFSRVFSFISNLVN